MTSLRSSSVAQMLSQTSSCRDTTSKRLWQAALYCPANSPDEMEQSKASTTQRWRNAAAESSIRPKTMQMRLIGEWRSTNRRRKIRWTRNHLITNLYQLMAIIRAAHSWQIFMAFLEWKVGVQNHKAWRITPTESQMVHLWWMTIRRARETEARTMASFPWHQCLHRPSSLGRRLSWFHGVRHRTSSGVQFLWLKRLFMLHGMMPEYIYFLKYGESMLKMHLR